MPFNAAYLSCVEASMGGLADRKMWFYTTTDNAATIGGAGYMTGASTRGMEVGDVVVVTTVTALPFTTPLGINVYVVSAIASDNATVIKTATA